MGKWYYADGKEKQPIEFEDLISNLSSKTMPMTTLVWTKGMEKWSKAQTVEEITIALEEFENSIVDTSDVEEVFQSNNSNFELEFENTDAADEVNTPQAKGKSKEKPAPKEKPVKPVKEKPAPKEKPVKPVKQVNITPKQDTSVKQDISELARIGIPIVLLGGVIFFAGLWSSLTQLGLGVFILTYESSLWLKKQTIRAIGFTALFTVISLLISNFSNLWSDLLRIASSVTGDTLSVGAISDLLRYARTGLSVVEFLVFFSLTISALAGREVKMNWVEKYIKSDEESN